MDLKNMGKFTFVAEPYITDFRGRVTIPMIGNYMLQSASEHAGGRGFGFNDMFDKNTAWVLSRLAIEMRELPKSNDAFYIYTWIEDTGKLFTNRNFEIHNADEQVIGYGRSIWAAIDINTRRATSLDVESLSAYFVDRPCPIEKPGKIAPAETDGEQEIPYSIKYSDLDINGHLNSIKSMEHLLDLFDLDTYTHKEITRFEIAYHAEGRYGMDLGLFRKEVAPDQYATAIMHEGKAICRAAIHWK